jgi:hypothetical protein
MGTITLFWLLVPAIFADLVGVLNGSVVERSLFVEEEREAKFLGRKVDWLLVK